MPKGSPYPTSDDSFNLLTALVLPFAAIVPNELAAAMEAVQSAIGVKPHNPASFGGVEPANPYDLKEWAQARTRYVSEEFDYPASATSHDVTFPTNHNLLITTGPYIFLQLQHNNEPKDTRSFLITARSSTGFTLKRNPNDANFSTAMPMSYFAVGNMPTIFSP